MRCSFKEKKNNNVIHSLLFDVVSALSAELGESPAELAANSEVARLLRGVTEQFLPRELLNLELSVWGADEPPTKTRVIKSKTRI